MRLSLRVCGKNHQATNDHFNRSASEDKISHLPRVEIHKPWTKIMWLLFIEKNTHRKKTCKTLLKNTISHIGENAQKLTSWEYYRNLQLTPFFTSWMQVWKYLWEFLFHCLPACLRASIFSVPFLTQFEICDLCQDAFVKCNLFMRFSPHVFINVQLLYSKITPAQNLLSLNEEEGL